MVAGMVARLPAGLCRIRVLAGKSDIYPLQNAKNSPETHTPAYPMSIVGSLFGGKSAGATG